MYIELYNTNAPQTVFDLTWSAPNAYRCHIGIIPEADGAFSVIVLNLPGCGSCGDTEEEAIRNAREAILGVIEAHSAANEEIPWKNTTPSDVPPGAKHKWILVNA